MTSKPTDIVASVPRDVVGPGESVRFAVIDAVDGRRSMTWTVVTSKNTLDAYLMARPMGHVWKMSLHESGEWHSGFTARGAQLLAPDAATRHIDTWQRPEEFTPGMHRGVQVVVPDSELRSYTGANPERQPKQGTIVAIPAPGAGDVAVIEVVFMVASELPALVLDGAFDVATLRRADGSVIRVIALKRPWDEQNRKAIESQRDEFLAKVPNDFWKSANAPRGCGLTTSSEGLRCVIDLAADPITSG